MSKLPAAAAGVCCHSASGAAVAGHAGGLWAVSSCRAPWLGSKLSAPEVLGCSVQSVVPEGVAVCSCACWCSSAAAAACVEWCLLPALSCSMDKRTYGMTERFKRLTLVSYSMLRFGQTSKCMHEHLQNPLLPSGRTICEKPSPCGPWPLLATMVQLLQQQASATTRRHPMTLAAYLFTG